MNPKSLSFHLEPTFRCNLGCEMCPRFSSEDPYLDMSLETYHRIAEAMTFAHTVDFTGWGESMLHPKIYQMIRMAKDSQCMTAMTSNGTALNHANCLRLIESGLDFLSISVDGMTRATFNKIRIGADFDRLVQNLQSLAQLLADRASRMELSIAFTIQEDNASELLLIPDFMKIVGATVLHLKHLNAISNQADWERSFLKYRLRPYDRKAFRRDPLRRLEKEIKEVMRQCEAEGMQVKMHSEFPMSSELKPRHCLAAPLDAVYFSFEGLVAPCCYFGHHVARYYDGLQHSPTSLFYGDIKRDNFPDIWNSPGFLEFRRGFATENYPDECKKCYLLYGK